MLLPAKRFSINLRVLTKEVLEKIASELGAVRADRTHKTRFLAAFESLVSCQVAFPAVHLISKTFQDNVYLMKEQKHFHKTHFHTHLATFIA